MDESGPLWTDLDHSGLVWTSLDRNTMASLLIEGGERQLIKLLALPYVKSSR